jgi:hypothetical protein
MPVVAGTITGQIQTATFQQYALPSPARSKRYNPLQNRIAAD